MLWKVLEKPSLGGDGTGEFFPHKHSCVRRVLFLLDVCEYKYTGALITITYRYDNK